MNRTIAGALVVLAIASCKKKSEEAPDAAPSASVSAVAPEADASGPPGPRTRFEHPKVEAQRLVVGKDDAWLAPHEAVLKEHFGTIPAKLAVQKVDADRRYVLVEGEKPLLLAIEADGKLAWKKDRPAAGITPPVGSLAIASGPKGRAAMAICDPPTKWTALRIWDDEGFPFADLQVIEGACEAVGLFYWQRHGWIVTSAHANELTKAQLVTEDAKMAWDKDKTFGARWRSLGLPSLAAYDKSSFLWVQYAGIESDPDQVFAYRFDRNGAPAWEHAKNLGAVRSAKDKVVLEPRGDRVHVTPPGVDLGD